MADENVIRREFQAELTPVGDGRTLDVRVVPYNQPTRVSDGGPSYMEEWVPGVFRNKDTKPNKVLVNIEHEKGFGGVVARCVGFTDNADGFDAELRMLSDPTSDKALELVNEGVFTGVSVEASPIQNDISRSGLVRRISAKLNGIALTRRPAFVDARVMAVREAPDGEIVGETGPELFVPAGKEVLVPDLSRTDEVLSRLGYEPIVTREVVTRPWNGSASRFTDEEYERSCLVCRAGDDPPKTRCSLPVLEPNGDLNRNALGAAASRLNQTGISMELKMRAARKLLRYYRTADMEPPPALVSLANR